MVPENGLTTPTLKINVPKLMKDFLKTINDWYKSENDVIWE